jgi:hypothetical protein
MQREHAFQYVECDVPEGVTLDRWRAERHSAAGRKRLGPLRALSLARRREADRSRDNA